MSDTDIVEAELARSLWVVDLETTSLDTDKAYILEVAAVNVETRQEIYFVPFVKRSVYAAAEPEALTVNRYFERRLYTQMLNEYYTANAYKDLAYALGENTFAGSNPTYDAAVLSRAFLDVTAGSSPRVVIDPKPWHHRLADLAAYAAGALGIDPQDSPGLNKACELLDVTNEDPHTAMGDARATAECFRRLMAGTRP
ncbi:3'-5' exonuclease [Rhodococcus zopfii]